MSMPCIPKLGCAKLTFATFMKYVFFFLQVPLGQFSKAKIEKHRKLLPLREFASIRTIW